MHHISATWIAVLAPALISLVALTGSAARTLPVVRRLYEQPDLLHGHCNNSTSLLEGHEEPVSSQKPRILTAKFANGFVDRRSDNFYWLRDDKRTNPEVLAHLEAENNYTNAVMAPTAELQQTLYDEMKGRIPPAEVFPPQRATDYWYYEYRVPSGQYPVLARRKLPPGLGAPSIHDEMDTTQPEQVLLDQNAIVKSSGSDFLNVGTMSVSPDGAWLAYSLDVTGNEVFSLYVRNVTQTSGKTAAKPQLFGPISGVAGGDVAWATDNSTFFLISVDPVTERASTLWRYNVTARGLSKGVLVYNETDPAFNLGLDADRSKKCIFLYASSAVTASVTMLEADKPTGSWVSLGARAAERQVQQVAERGSHLFMLVSDPARRNGELLIAPLSKVSRTTVLLEHNIDVQIVSFSLFEGHLTVLARENGVVTPLVYDLPANINEEVRALGEPRALQLPEDSYSLELESQGPFQSVVLRLHYNSLITPPTTFDFDLRTGERQVKREMEVVGGYDSNNYQAERLWARAEDGTQVPISLVYRRDLLRVGGEGSPLLLEGYGAYSFALDPFFSPDRLSLVDRGFVWAFAHVRGGGELGAYWYQAGKLLSKRNTFTDFIACAEHLIKEGYTSESRLAIWGRSAGGLTVGASMNMRPSLFKAVILDVPFVDVLTTERSPEMPLTVGEWQEWGDPLHNATMYEYIKSYSPVDNVKPQRYPHLFVTAGLQDPRVSYWEPAKLVAKIRTLRQDQHLLMLRVNMEAGHFAASGIYDHLLEVAMKYAFLMHALSACPDAGDVPGSIRRLVDAASVIAGVVGLAILAAIIFGISCWARARRQGQSAKEVAMRTFPHIAGYSEMQFSSQSPAFAGSGIRSPSAKGQRPSSASSASRAATNGGK